jgi:hypothetical protein
MHAVGMDKTMRYKTIPLSVVYRWRIKNKTVKQAFVLPCQQADDNRNNNDKSGMV